MNHSWITAECKHEYRQDELLVMDEYGAAVYLLPAYCPECGHTAGHKMVWPMTGVNNDRQ